MDAEDFSILYPYQRRLSHRHLYRTTLLPFLTLKLDPYSFLFRQYKDKEEEHQSGFFSALTNMVSSLFLFFKEETSWKFSRRVFPKTEFGMWVLEEMH